MFNLAPMAKCLLNKISETCHCIHRLIPHKYVAKTTPMTVMNLEGIPHTMDTISISCVSPGLDAIFLLFKLEVQSALISTGFLFQNTRIAIMDYTKVHLS